METLKITVDSDSPDDLLDLYRWMTDEADTHLHPERKSVPQDGAMGAYEYLDLVVSPEIIGGLVACICAWIKYRRPKIEVHLEPETGKVIVKSENSGNTEELVAEVKKRLKDE